MESKKNLQIDAAICDARFVTEETLTAYGQVKIDCALLISSAEARTLLAKRQVEISASSTLDLAGDVQVSSVNGSMVLAPGQALPAEKTFLLVNGSLDIVPGCEEILKGYTAVMVNGTVDVPESMVGRLTGLTINGAIRTYPDGCIRLNHTTVLDRTFPLRTRQDALYYAANRIIALDGNIGFGKLAEKNVRFATKKLLIAEGLVEEALPLFDEKTDIQILPDGCAYLNDDVKLTESIVRRHGGKLYVDGDLILLEDGPWLDQVSYLQVNGDVLVTRELEDRLNAMDVSYETLYFVGGALRMGQANARLTCAMLEDAERGVSFVSCSDITVDEDVPVQLLREKLVSIIACGHVFCTKAQRAVIEPLAQLTNGVGPREDKDEMDEKDEDPNKVRINGAFYTL